MIALHVTLSVWMKSGKSEHHRAIDRQYSRKEPYQEKMKPIIRVPEGSYYAAVEGSRGEFGVFLESHGDKMPYRLHFRSYGLAVCCRNRHHLPGQKIADLIAIGGTMDYVVPDIDR